MNSTLVGERVVVVVVVVVGDTVVVVVVVNSGISTLRTSLYFCSGITAKIL